MKRHRNTARSAATTAAILALTVGVIDLSTNTSATGILTAAVAIPHINPPPRDIAEKRTSVTPNALFIQIRWPNGFPHDVDTYLQCYVEGSDGKKHNMVNVNFRQKSDKWLNLKVDDLGRPSVINVEEVQSNSQVATVPPLTFCRLNVHLYHSHGGIMPFTGVFAMIADKDADNEKLLASGEFVISEPGEESTLVTVSWDTRGRPILSSIKSYPNVDTVGIATTIFRSAPPPSTNEFDERRRGGR